MGRRAQTGKSPVAPSPSAPYMRIMTQPALFLGHGSPLTAFEDNPLTRSWSAIGRSLAQDRPKAVLCISAHWETKGVLITAAERPRTIHDFYGFPPALYAYEYPAPGDPALARELQERLSAFRARADLDGWGLDHGCWSAMKFLFPDADVPVLQLSLDLRRSPREHFEIGRALAPLRDEGVLIVGTGNIVHNLRLYDPRAAGPEPWAKTFDDTVVRLARAGDDDALIDYLSLGPEAALSAPEPDHFLPLLYVLAARLPGEHPAVFNRDVRGSLSMTSLAYGQTALAA
jgi:4,5-DOPA dioxygenase extradiol